MLGSQNAPNPVQQNQVSFQSQSFSDPTIAIKLPRLSLNKFYGDPSTFLEFYGQFENAIHKNNSLSKVEKLKNLKSLVGGGAASAIKGLELKDENYNSALEILHSRYGNKDVLIQAHLGSLLNITPIKTSNDLNALRTMYDKIETQIRNLESLSVDTKKRENLNYNREISSATELLANSKKPNYHSRNVRNSKGSIAYGFNQSSPLNKHRDAGNESLCVFHKINDHSSAACQLDLGSKQDIVRRERRCWLCLHKLCRKNNCSSNIKCGHCNSRSHNQAFCFDYHKSVNLEKKEGSEAVVSNVTHNNSEIYLQTAAGQFIGRKGSSLIRRIIFDGGSQRTFLESKLARELNLPVVGREMLTVHTFQSEKPTKHVYPKVRIRVKSLISNKEIVIEALETKQLSSAHISIPAKEVRERFESLGLELADVPVVLDKGACEIGLLVGSDNYWKFVGNRIERLDESLVAVETIFGFCIHCSVSEDKDNDERSVNLVVSKESISDQLNQFWQLENLGIEVEEDIKDISENEILKSFESSIEYSSNRYKVGLPWKPEMKHLLDDNRSVALNRHSKLVKRFNRDKLLFKNYKKIIDDYAKENIVESVIETPKLQGSPPTFYLPHTCVKRLDKTTTKIRIVFDGSSHGENQLSLNDCLNSGVNLNPDLLELILKFRENPIAYTADIEKAFF
ncbi:integrase catalytic domain-containing protein [Trichonephila clavata]|uniref:Integrase catalytic domain-containing protein n=1 Tax=Trichonephila clavata TaxID=2740835 RepID=A0A8X6HH41_TRICU|nr:integrase catalytic domain-containing protein [Trichonephila clavata]